MRDGARGAPHDWTFLTNHAHVLLAIASDPTRRLRDIAAIVGITERFSWRIISELEETGYIARERVGRRNRYVIDRSRPLRHPREAHHQIGELLQAMEHSAEQDAASEQALAREVSELTARWSGR